MEWLLWVTVAAVIGRALWLERKLVANRRESDLTFDRMAERLADYKRDEANWDRQIVNLQRLLTDENVKAINHKDARQQAEAKAERLTAEVEKLRAGVQDLQRSLNVQNANLQAADVLVKKQRAQIEFLFRKEALLTHLRTVFRDAEEHMKQIAADGPKPHEKVIDGRVMRAATIEAAREAIAKGQTEPADSKPFEPAVVGVRFDPPVPGFTRTMPCEAKLDYFPDGAD